MAQNAENYSEYRDKMIEQGKQFQDFVSDLLWDYGIVFHQYTSGHYQRTKGEGKTGIEVKLDQNRKRFNSLYIETAEKATPRQGAYYPSGVMSTGHWLFAIGDYEVVYMFATSTLRLLETMSKWERKETPTSQGFILPEAEANRYAGLVLKPAASLRLSG